MVKLRKKTILKKAEPINDPAFNDIKNWYESNLHPDVLDLQDKTVYDKIYKEGNWGGVFQCTAKGAQMFFSNLEPKNIVEIATATSIYRPGPLTGKVDKTYITAKNDPASVEYEHPLVKEVLEETFGHVIFQEQLMKLGHVVGGLNLDDCDKLRKVITKRSMSGKSKAKEEAKKLEKQFIEGAVERGIRKADAESLFDRVAAFSGYGFNKTLLHSECINTYTNEGELIKTTTVGDIKPGDYIKSRDERNKSDIFVEVLQRHDHGMLELYEFELEEGQKVRCTMDHKFRVMDGRMLPMHKIIENDLEIVAGNVGRGEELQIL